MQKFQRQITKNYFKLSFRKTSIRVFVGSNLCLADVTMFPASDQMEQQYQEQPNDFVAGRVHYMKEAGGSEVSRSHGM